MKTSNLENYRLDLDLSYLEDVAYSHDTLMLCLDTLTEIGRLCCKSGVHIIQVIIQAIFLQRQNPFLMEFSRRVLTYHHHSGNYENN